MKGIVRSVLHSKLVFKYQCFGIDCYFYIFDHIDPIKPNIMKWDFIKNENSWFRQNLAGILFSTILIFLLLCSIIFFNYIVAFIFPHLKNGKLIDKSLHLETLKFIGYVLGGGLLVWQIVLTNKRTKAAESTARASVDISKAATENAKAALKSAENTLKNIQVIEQGQIQERFKNAIEQLGSDKQPVILGAIYTLHHIAKADDKLCKSVFNILCSFIRETTSSDVYQKKQDTSIVIQSILNLLFIEKNESEIYDQFSADLSGAYLVGADLSYSVLYKANLINANLTHSRLNWANLSKTLLAGTNFTGAHLNNTDFGDAVLFRTLFECSDLKSTKFHGIKGFQGVNLKGAIVDGNNWFNTLRENNTGVEELENRFIITTEIIYDVLDYVLQPRDPLDEL
jgi:hypothetical protein